MLTQRLNFLGGGAYASQESMADHKGAMPLHGQSTVSLSSGYHLLTNGKPEPANQEFGECSAHCGIC